MRGGVGGDDVSDKAPLTTRFPLRGTCCSVRRSSVAVNGSVNERRRPTFQNKLLKVYLF